MDEFDLDDITDDDLLERLRTMPKEQIASLAKKAAAEQRRRLREAVSALLLEATQAAQRLREAAGQLEEADEKENEKG